MIETANGTDVELWAIVVAFLLPLLFSVIIQTGWDSRVQALLAFVGILVIATVGLLIQGQFDTSNLVHTFLVMFVTTIVAYHGLWKPIRVAPAIESFTNLSSGPGDLK